MSDMWLGITIGAVLGVATLIAAWVVAGLIWRRWGL